MTGIAKKGYPMPVESFYTQTESSFTLTQNFSWLPPGHPALAPFDIERWPWQDLACFEWHAKPLPPVSNTGVNAPSDSAQVDKSAPLPRSDQSAFIDTFSMTVHIADFFGSEGAHHMSKVWPSELIELFRPILNQLGFGIDQNAKPKGINGYQVALPVCYPEDAEYKNLGFVAAGGNGDTINLHLTGEACGCLQPLHWGRLYTWLLDKPSAKVTRIDLAHDDYDGIRTVDDALQLWLDKAYHSAGLPPSMCQHGNWTSPDGTGRTIEIGKRGSGKMLRVYEKGKQLGNPESPWVRWELELRKQGRVIPLDVLLRPGDYLKGAYKCLHWMKGIASTVKTIRKTAEITIARMKEYAKRNVGRLLYALVQFGQSASGIVNELMGNEIPKRLQGSLPFSGGYELACEGGMQFHVDGPEPLTKHFDLRSGQSWEDEYIPLGPPSDSEKDRLNSRLINGIFESDLKAR